MSSGEDALPIAEKIEKTDIIDRESDADLLTYISWRHESEDEARRAFGVFYERYFKQVAYLLGQFAVSVLYFVLHVFKTGCVRDLSNTFID